MISQDVRVHVCVCQRANRPLGPASLVADIVTPYLIAGTTPDDHRSLPKLIPAYQHQWLRARVLGVQPQLARCSLSHPLPVSPLRCTDSNQNITTLFSYLVCMGPKKQSRQSVTRSLVQRCRSGKRSFMLFTVTVRMNSISLPLLFTLPSLSDLLMTSTA